MTYVEYDRNQRLAPSVPPMYACGRYEKRMGTLRQVPEVRLVLIGSAAIGDTMCQAEQTGARRCEARPTNIAFPLHQKRWFIFYFFYFFVFLNIFIQGNTFICYKQY